ncbi:alkaline phosphatase [Veillonella intestinalis]|uniref:alkaline phosphatase n=1 Tax=Veillonella intestinalis TaxID=2941341 RepID=UPI00203BB1DF|nr:alkaline phosphatase [Veillonella intestinalis]
MNGKQHLRKMVFFALAGALAFGINAPMVKADAPAPAVTLSSQTELSATAVISKDIKVLPINQAKFWQGQRFDFEVELPLGTKQVAVTINGEDASKVFKETPTLTQHSTHISYRINDVAFKEVGDKRVNVVAATNQGTLKQSASYKVVNEKAQKKAKNVILFVGDGMSMQAKEVARILSKGLSDGKFNDILAMEKMPHMALVTTSGYDSLVTDSANSASAYNTGNKSVVNAMGVYENSTADPLDDPKVENISEIISRSKDMSYGMVTTAAVTDATPAAVTAHTRRRGEQNFIATDFLNRAKPPAVILGGGSQFFLPLSTPGSKRKDNVNVIQEFKDKGYQFAGNKTDLAKTTADKPLLGLFTLNTMNVYMDRQFLPENPTVLKGFNDQPGLVDMTKKAIEVLEKNPNGFFLMSEAGSIDKQLHTMDWQRSAYDTIEFDQAIKYAQDYSKAHGDNTLIIVVADHAHGISITGTYSEQDGKVGREAVRVYGEAGWPTFIDANRDGFPDNPDADVTLAVQYANSPDHYENYRFQTEPHDPATAGKDGKVIANPKRAPQGARLVEGSLPTTTGETSEVHSADDVVLMAQGPGSEYFSGVMDNTEVFFGILRALGIDGNKDVLKK